MARITAPLAALLLLFSAVPALAEVGPEPDGTIPVDPRDFSGIWMNDNSLDERLKREGLRRLDPAEAEAPPPVRPVPLTPEYEAIRAQMAAERARWEEGVEPCGWPGTVRLMGYPYPFEMLHTPGRVTIIFETESQVRRIFLDRTEHLPFDELDPSYNGDSIGRWDGDTLVVETIGFNTMTELGGGIPHSEEMRLVERFRYIDGDTIQVDMTITDPLALTAPIERTFVYSKRPDWRIREYSCLENNRDAPGAEGERVGGVVAGGHTEDEQANIATVLAFYDAALNAKDADLAASYLGERYIQHNPAARDGEEGMRGFVGWLAANFPDNRSEVRSAFADGDRVILHVHTRRTPDQAGNAIMEIFRLEQGRIVEHWDVIQPIPAEALNQNGMF